MLIILLLQLIQYDDRSSTTHSCSRQASAHAQCMTCDMQLSQPQMHGIKQSPRATRHSVSVLSGFGKHRMLSVTTHGINTAETTQYTFYNCRFRMAILYERFPYNNRCVKRHSEICPHARHVKSSYRSDKTQQQQQDSPTN